MIKRQTPRESKIEKVVTDYAKGKGWLVFKWSSPGYNGVPDRIFIRGGYVTFIEFKRECGKVTALQSLIHAQLLKHEFKVHVVYGIEEGKKLIDSFEVLKNF